jgi:hypothetical protein
MRTPMACRYTRSFFCKHRFVSSNSRRPLRHDTLPNSETRTTLDARAHNRHAELFLMGGRSVDALFNRIRRINSCPVNSTRQPSLSDRRLLNRQPSGTSPKASSNPESGCDRCFPQPLFLAPMQSHSPCLVQQSLHRKTTAPQNLVTHGLALHNRTPPVDKASR